MKNRLEFNEENLINLITEKDGIKKSIYYTGKPIDELFKYKNMWNELKEWFNKHYELNLKAKDKDANVLKYILDKISELEKGEKDE